MSKPPVRKTILDPVKIILGTDYGNEFRSERDAPCHKTGKSCLNIADSSYQALSDCQQQLNTIFLGVDANPSDIQHNIISVQYPSGDEYELNYYIPTIFLERARKKLYAERRKGEQVQR